MKTSVVRYSAFPIWSVRNMIGWGAVLLFIAAFWDSGYTAPDVSDDRVHLRR